MSDELKCVPEVFMCSYCGKNIWAIAEHIISPEQLICGKCKESKRKEWMDNPEKKEGE